MKNKYAKRALISDRKFQQLVRLFSAGLEASQIAKSDRIEPQHSQLLFNKKQSSVWLNIATHNLLFQERSKLTSRSLVRVMSRTKEAVAYYGNTFIFSISQRNGHAYTKIVPNFSKVTLQAIICTDDWRGYNGLVMLVVANTSVSITVRMNLPRAVTTSTELKASGATQKHN